MVCMLERLLGLNLSACEFECSCDSNAAANHRFVLIGYNFYDNGTFLDTCTPDAAHKHRHYIYINSDSKKNRK